MPDDDASKKAKAKGSTVVAKAKVHHVVVAFEGFNVPFVEDGGEEIPESAKNTVNEILAGSTASVANAQVEVHKKGYSTDVDEDARDAAKAFIEEKLKVIDGKQRGKLIVYGYSMGGDTAVELAAALEEKYSVDLLVTVDAATFQNIGVDREIPANVRRNVNFWTENPQTSWGQAGGENKAANPDATKVQNIPKHEESHASIDEATKPAVIKLIKAELKNRRLSPSAERIELLFDGAKLRVETLITRQVLGEYDAISGLPPGAPALRKLIAEGRSDLDASTDYTRPEHQHVADAGPIPEETYELPLRADMPFDKTPSDGAGWGLGGWRLESGFFGDFSVIVFGARGGFFLHEDGGARGTSGCIGLVRRADLVALKDLLIRAQRLGQEEVEVHVSYPAASGSAP